MPTCIDIIEAYLMDNGYDGLCNDDCGCTLADPVPCSQCFDYCEPAYDHGPSEDYDHTMRPEPPVTDDQLDLLRHALGMFDGEAGKDRNHFAINAENAAEVEDLRQLVRWKLAIRIALPGSDVLHFKVTEKGKELVKP